MRVVVTGHRGLVGSAVCRRLAEEKDVEVITTGNVDLRIQERVHGFFDGIGKVDALIMCAAKVGGVLGNSSMPHEYLYDNIAIQQSLFREAAATQIQKVIFLGSVCVYPRDAETPIKEEALLTGPLEPTNQGYALAKIVGIEAVRLAHRMGLQWIALMPSNLFGTHDNFNLTTGHAVPALLRKAQILKFPEDCLDVYTWAHEVGKSKQLEVWGNPNTYRELLFSDDLADAIVFMLRQPEYEHHLYNVGSGDGVTISTLAQLILKTAELDVPIVYTPGKPVGAPVRMLDSKRINDLGWSSKTTIAKGLEKTWKWMLETKEMRT